MMTSIMIKYCITYTYTLHPTLHLYTSMHHPNVEVLLQPSRLAGTLQVICTEAENDIPVYVPIHVLDLNHPLANPATPTC